MVGNFGKFADPMKLLVMSAYYADERMVWLGLLQWIVCRKLAVTGFKALLVENSGTILAAAMPGKTFLVRCLLLFSLCYYIDFLLVKFYFM